MSAEPGEGQTGRRHTTRPSDSFPPGSTAVTLAPDSGERYLDTVYAPLWREEHYGARSRLTGRHTLPTQLPPTQQPLTFPRFGGHRP